MPRLARAANLSLALLCACAWGTACRAENPAAYKWVDDQGVTHYGDRIPPLKREDVLRKLTAYANDMARDQKDKQDNSGKKAKKSSTDEGAPGIVPMFFAVRCPGKILTSNGQYDETQNEAVAVTSPSSFPSTRTSPSTLSVPTSESRGPSTTIPGESGCTGVAVSRAS